VPAQASIHRAARAGLDVLLAEAVVDQGASSRFLRPTAAAGVLAGLARRPARPLGRIGGLGIELGRVAVGRSERRPAKGDRRFADPAWDGNWLLRRVMGAYLSVGDTVDGLISDAEVGWRSERQARFAAGNILDALAPTNFPWSNPSVMKATVDEGGANLVRGARRFARDVSRPPRLPATVDASKFAVGENLALSAGAVVMRTEVFELIHYKPQTELVHEVPLLFVPPTINKYYILDIAPGRSLVEHLVRAGQQVFMVSWRNPDEDQGHFDLDTYAQAILDARDAVARITRQPSVHLNAACSGGIIASGALGHLAAEKALDGVASLTLMVCALDNARAGTTAAFASRDVAAAAVAESARRGYVDGRALAGVFAWLRPNDLVWGYVVNNYLLGKAPPAFDILYWNQDTVRLAAGVHRDFIRLSLQNSLTKPGGMTVLGSPVDLSAVDVDSYVIGGLNDHIIPWENAYRSARLLGGRCRFVLSTSGHIQALVNPPPLDGKEPRSSFRAAEDLPTDPATFLEQTPVRRGSWWGDYVGWLAERSGELRTAPKRLGDRRYKAIARAPGSYVHAA
jgi:polyhydroxyalkanoate synthase subunit PhaC